MSKCNGFERDAHMTKIHHLQPGDLVSPRRVVKTALLGEQVLTPRAVLVLARPGGELVAIEEANKAIERRAMPVPGLLAKIIKKLGW